MRALSESYADGGILCFDTSIEIAHSYFAVSALQRMRGLLAYQEISAVEALVIERCNSVHTFGMRYAIDVVFVNSTGKIVRLARNLMPARMSGSFSSSKVVELVAGSCLSLGIAEGMQISRKLTKESL